jgi:hypothetical protein
MIGETEENNVTDVIHCGFVFVKSLKYVAFYNLTEI